MSDWRDELVQWALVSGPEEILAGGARGANPCAPRARI
jgi:hypothetical protein